MYIVSFNLMYFMYYINYQSISNVISIVQYSSFVLIYENLYTMLNE